ncbi:MAG: nucleotidyltransferase [Flavobacteriaceae bacterium]|nr:nucleotidyltransferase [Flavobacteriaceae bacterium]MCB0474652.1 nucleotidyltransferase [Flavobacteriaceae bacterium]
MKIIVPMAGIGSRLRPHTLTIPKPLTIIAGKPIVQRLVEDIAAVLHQKVEEIAFVIGPSFPSDTEKKLADIAFALGATCKISVQQEALGTAHAIQCARESLDGPCVVAFADTLFRAHFTLDENADGAIWVKKVANPRAYGVVKLNGGVITDFVEKPQEFVSDLAIIGIYYFKDAGILRDEIQYLLDNEITEKGEYQLTNALENMKQKGLKFVPGQVDEWMDCGNKEITVETNGRVLEIEHEKGNDLVADDIILENSKIIQPCYIGKNVKLVNATVGPNVSLGANSIVENAKIAHSLIQNHVKIKNADLKGAMIGNFAEFDGNFTSVSIGDYSVLN